MAFYNGTSGNDTHHGTATADQIFGNNGNDYLYGEGGNDFIEADGVTIAWAATMEMTLFMAELVSIR